MITSNVKALMKGKKKTIHALASLSGVSAVTINRARQDAGISKCLLLTLVLIAEALCVSVNDLFDGEYEPSTPGRGANV